MTQFNENHLENKELSVRLYNVSIGLVILWGFAINILLCKFGPPVFQDWNRAGTIITCTIIAILGVFFAQSGNAFINFFGYNMIVIPLGVILSLALVEFDSFFILNALLVTSIVTLTMLILASVAPKIFLSMGKVLFSCLLTVVVFEILLILLGISTPSIWDWLVALLFCGYVGYDWAKAQKKQRTLANAVESAVDLYLDILNIFIRSASASNKSRRK